ncbi:MULTISPECIES: rhomboid family intramembrane serine protease [unclassified Streptomyces]|jgi:membrane associated rhomboid family serine protease|uniref:rhomboid family intramembrane serine protease n=1 Tax=unclassified Streptomyces TaxID=2593676 RepID=UPI00081B0281|nr:MULTISPECIES: rhomboid family intramembrane serine protease [unclassified Streptomyces]MYQ83491.1 rhomboid family intramembrane serine protease [Streptomyces sp. SID4936]SCD67265.1 Membrane associated serine protease, rhomboid family [Streptomyces sp. DvalAA-43]
MAVSSHQSAPAWDAGGRARTAAKVMLVWVAFLWLLEIVDASTGHALDTFGIEPRRAAELLDVVPASFIHFGFGHVAANSLPLLVFGFLAALSGVRRFAAVAAMIIVVDGLGVWLVSPSGSNTAGASGLVFGLFGYLLVRGFVDRRLLDIGAGLVIGAIWGSSILVGISPANTSVSWQGHLFGLAAGVAAAFVFRRRGTPASARPLIP